MRNDIAILTTVANFMLYEKTAPMFPAGIQKYVIDGTNGMHGLESIKYMFKKLKGKNIKWLIMADEDVIFSNSNAVFDVISHMEKNDYTVCGVRDGGVIQHRNQNPYLINTFFSIINFETIEKIWDKEQVLKNQFVQKNEFKDNISHLPYKYDELSIYEPYYCFYLWLRRKGNNFLFLEASNLFESDDITNAVYDLNCNVILYHTWYARSYGVNVKHTKRIDNVLDKYIISEPNFVKPVIMKDRTYPVRKSIVKFIKKVKMKLGKA